MEFFPALKETVTIGRLAGVALVPIAGSGQRRHIDTRGGHSGERSRKDVQATSRKPGASGDNHDAFRCDDGINPLPAVNADYRFAALDRIAFFFPALHADGKINGISRLGPPCPELDA